MPHSVKEDHSLPIARLDAISRTESSRSQRPRMQRRRTFEHVTHDSPCGDARRSGRSLSCQDVLHRQINLAHYEAF